MNRLDPLLRPRSIAVLGAGWARMVVTQSRSMGFAGPIWPVHPTRDEIGGERAFRSIADLPEPPDATFIGVNRHATVEVVGELAAIGARGAIAFAAGWREAGEAALEAALVQAAGQMPVLGPNCYGVINYLDGALLWPDVHGGKRVDRGVALISQSSNIIVNIGMQRRGLPVAYAACLGNATIVGLAELAGAVIEDDRVTALGMYVEGIDDAPALAALADRAAVLGKAIIVIKAGKTAGGQAAAQSHTASLAGAGVASSAFLARTGILEVDTPSELIEALKIAHMHGRRIGGRLCSVSCSGGEAGLASDVGGPLGLTFPPVPEATRADLSDILGPLVAIANPLDYHTFIWGDRDKTAAVFATMLAPYDAGVFIIDVPREDRCAVATYEPALDAIGIAAQVTGKIAFPLASMAENFGEDRAWEMMSRGVVPLLGFETGLKAIKALQTEAPPTGWRPLPAMAPRDAALLSEAEGKALLAQAGIAVPRGKSGPTLAALDATALVPPLALKGLGFAHKSEAGAVRLGLTTLSGQAEMAGATGYLVEEMVTGTVAEVLLGLRRDPIYGISVTLGMGGVTAELLADTVTLIWPASEADVLTALRQLRLWPLLDGYRGRARADVAALAAMAVRLGALMERDASLEEIEINPVLLRESGAVAVDALIRRA